MDRSKWNVTDWADCVSGHIINEYRDTISEMANKGKWNATYTQQVIEESHRQLADWFERSMKGQPV
jgi:hypothetical protein